MEDGRCYQVKGFTVHCHACGHTRFRPLPSEAPMFEDLPERDLSIACVECGKIARFDQRLIREGEGDEPRAPLI